MAEEELVARLRAVGQAGFTSTMRAAGASVRGVGTSASITGRALSLATGPLRVFGTTAKWAAGAGIVALTTATYKGTAAGFGYNKMIDSQRVGFTTLLGSQKAALKFMARIRQLALKSPVLDPETTGDAARLLMAYGISAKKTLPFVKALGDMSAATGRSIQETLPRGAMALGQIASKGKLQAEELNQLAESVGLSRDRIRKELNMTRDEFEAAFTPGNSIAATEALPAIMRAMEKQSGGAAKRLSKTTAGRLDQLREVFKMKMGALTKGAWNLVGRFARGLTDRLKDFNPKAFLRSVSHFTSQVREGFSAGLGGKGAMGFNVGGIANVLGRGLRAAIPVVKTAVKGIAKAVSVAVPAIAKFIGGIDFRAIGSKIARIAKTVAKVVATIAKAVVHGAGQLLDALKPAAPFVENVLWPVLKGLAKGIVGSLVVAFKLAVPVIKVLAEVLGFLGNLLRPFRGLFEKIGEVVGFVFGGPILNAIKGLGKLGKVLRFAGGFVKFFSRGIVGLGTVVINAGKFLLGIVDGPLKAIGKAFEWVWGKVKTLIGWFGTLKDAIGDAFTGGVGAVRGVFEGVVQFFQDRINNLIDIINGAIKGYNAIPLAPNIGLIGRVGSDGSGGTGGTYDPSTDGTDPTSAGSDRARPGAAGGVPGADSKGNSRGVLAVNPAAPRAGATPTPLGRRAALFHIEVPVKVGRREFGRASASIAADDLARG